MNNVQYIIDISKYSPDVQAKFIELNNWAQKDFVDKEIKKNLNKIFPKDESTKSIGKLPDLLSPLNIANHLGISRRRVYEYCQLSDSHGGLKSFQIGKSRKIDKIDFIAWLEKQKEGKPNE